jgi:hypothetical protein
MTAVVGSGGENTGLTAEGEYGFLEIQPDDYRKFSSWNIGWLAILTLIRHSLKTLQRAQWRQRCIFRPP